MNKDDILAMSRAENHGNDEYEKQVLEKAGKLSTQVGLLFLGLFIVELVRWPHG